MEDNLRRRTIESTDTFEIDIADDTGTCRFGVRAVFESGCERVEKRIDVCEDATFTDTR